MVYAYSHARYKKDKRKMDKQIEKAKILIGKKETGRPAKFQLKAQELLQTPWTIMALIPKLN